MCGICGIYYFEGGPTKQEVARMNRAILHRGPDDHGIWMGGNIALGHRRLSILDLSINGHQPMLTSDKRFALVFNGEIYNYNELKKELIMLGHSFKSSSDTEVILYGFVEWRETLLAKLNGMFAFAIWDNEEQTLLLARDRFGIKPLYYHVDTKKIVFASEIKAILTQDQSTFSISPRFLQEYIWFGNGLSEQTIFNKVYSLEPGQFLVAKGNKILIKNHWDISNIKPTRVSRNDAIKNTEIAVRNAVERHMLADVEIGVLLSGGLDSSCITAFASEFSSQPLKTYSIEFDFMQGDSELAKAREVAKLFSTEHHELYIKGQDVKDVIEAMVLAHDQPFADAANIPLYLISKQLSGSLKVLLQGDGGDEIFAGYRRYNVLAYNHFWTWLSRIGMPLLRLLPKNQRYYQIKRLFNAMSCPDTASKFAYLLTLETPDFLPQQVFSNKILAYINEEDAFAPYKDQFGKLDHMSIVQQMLYLDVSLLLPKTFLEKVDRATMANSLEVRVPLLDTEITDLVMPMPANYKVYKSQKKWLLKQVLASYLPENIINAPKKGFGVPYGNWLRTSLAEYMQSVLFDKSISQLNFFNQNILRECIDAHLSGQRDFGFLLWKCLNLALWLENYKKYLDLSGM